MTASVKRKEIFCFAIWLFLLLFLCILSVGAETTDVVFSSEGQEISRVQVSAGQPFTLPEAVVSEKGLFLGWAADLGEGTALYADNATLTLPNTAERVQFSAFFLDLRTMNGAAVSLKPPYSLRFDLSVPQSELSTLRALRGVSKIQFGLLTAPADRLRANGVDFTLEKGDALTVHEAKTPTFRTETIECYSARVHLGSEKELLERTAARAFLTVVLETGETRTVYAPYSAADHVRTAHGVLAAAYEDVEEQQSKAYPYPLKSAAVKSTEDIFPFFSPYRETERETIREGLDRVISVHTPAKKGEMYAVENVYSKNQLTFLPFRFYHSPYEVKAVRESGAEITVEIVGKSGGDVTRISSFYLGGSYDKSLLSACRVENGVLYIVQRGETFPSV